MPVLMRGAQAALSPSFGAPATPVAWQALHTPSKVALPDAAAGLAAPPAAGGIVTDATASAGVAAGAAAAGAGAFGSITTWAAGARRLVTSAGDIAGSSFIERAPWE